MFDTFPLRQEEVRAKNRTFVFTDNDYKTEC